MTLLKLAEPRDWNQSRTRAERLEFESAPHLQFALRVALSAERLELLEG